jgi:hypothetical protein
VVGPEADRRVLDLVHVDGPVTAHDRQHLAVDHARRRLSHRPQAALNARSLLPADA